MSIRTASSNPAYRRDGGTPPPMAVQACPDTVAEDRMGDGDRRYGFCCTKGPRQAHARLLKTMSTGRCPVALPKWIADHCGVRDRWVRPGPMVHPTGWEHIAPRRHSPSECHNCPHTACLCAVLRICRVSANTLRREARQPRIGDTPCRGSALCSRQALPRSRGHHGPAPNTLTDRSTSQTCST